MIRSLFPDVVPQGRINAALKWHGGKFFLAGWIIDHMPDHIHYVEPYAGGLAVLLQKPYDGVSEVVNDLNGELMTFWRVLQGDESFAAFQRIIEATPVSQVEFRDALEMAADPIRRAANFFIRCRQSRQGLMRDFATLSKTRTRRQMNEQCSSWLTAVDGLADVHSRLKRVVILNDDAVAIIRREDTGRTLFYCDPPYLAATRVTTNDYAHEMCESDHQRLLETLAGIKGKFLLSGYPSRLYDDFASRHGWRRVEQEIDCKASAAGTKPKRLECLWMN